MSESPIIIFLGRLHPAVVHFPIALLTLAALLEGWQFLRRRTELHPATAVCLVIGTLASFAAALFGWFLEETSGSGGQAFDLHKWVGVVAMVTAFVALLFWWRSAASTVWMLMFRGVLLGVAALVGATGYLGGELVFGSNHLLKGLLPEPAAHVERTPAARPEPGPDTGKVEFARSVAPIFQQYCLRCHGGDKIKGKVDLRTHEALLKSGRGSSQALVPGQPEQSTLVASLVTANPEERMPPKKEQQLTPAQIETIRKWVAEGADWPAGFEFK
ncbi:MAG: c-type cytochrome domain-containing protein [Gemmataceae bacterium]